MKENSRIVNLGIDGLVFLALYYELSFVFSDFEISAVFGAVIFLAYIVLLLFNKHFIFQIRLNSAFQSNSLFWLILLIICINYPRVKQLSTDWYYLIIWFLSALIIQIVNEVRYSNAEKALRIFIAFGFLMGLAQIIYRFSPSLIEGTLFQIISSHDREYNYWITSQGYGFVLSGEVDFTAIVMALGLGALFYLPRRDNSKKRIVPFIIGLIIFTGFVLLQRRGELIATIIALILTSWLTLNNKGLRVWQLALINTLLAAIVIFFAFESFLPTSSNNRMLQMLIDVVNHKDVGNGRTVIYAAAIKAFLQNPLFGMGWNGFSKISYSTTGLGLIRNVHNIYLQLLCEVGIVGSIFAYFAIFRILLNTYEKAKANETDTKKLFEFALFLQIFILIYGLVDNPLYKFYFPLLYTFSLLITEKTMVD